MFIDNSQTGNISWHIDQTDKIKKVNVLIMMDYKSWPQLISVTKVTATVFIVLNGVRFRADLQPLTSSLWPLTSSLLVSLHVKMLMNMEQWLCIIAVSINWHSPHFIWSHLAGSCISAGIRPQLMNINEHVWWRRASQRGRPGWQTTRFMLPGERWSSCLQLRWCECQNA